MWETSIELTTFSTDTRASISKAKLWNIKKKSINCQSHALIDLLPLLLLLACFFCSYCDTMFHAKIAYVTFCRTNAHFDYVLNFNLFYDNKSNWCFFWCCAFLFNFKNNVFQYLQHFFFQFLSYFSLRFLHTRILSDFYLIFYLI